MHGRMKKIAHTKECDHQLNSMKFRHVNTHFWISLLGMKCVCVCAVYITQLCSLVHCSLVVKSPGFCLESHDGEVEYQLHHFLAL